MSSLMGKRVLFHAVKWLGLFHVARAVTAKRLRVLCYHGVSLNGESQFRPQLFVETPTLRRRLAYLARKRFPVWPLDRAITALAQGSLPRRGATVITFDDGFYSVLRSAVPLLERFGMPATLYATTYYSVKGTPVFRLVVQYMLWKTTRPSIDLVGILPGADGAATLRTRPARETVAWRIIEHGEAHCGEAQRTALLRELGARLGVNYDEIVRTRILSLMTPDELRTAGGRGLGVQLHGHRHRACVDPDVVGRELEDNRTVLAPLAPSPLRHYAFPSGTWSEATWPALRAAGVTSATTCEPGLNTDRTPLLALRRFLDSEAVSQIEFEAEMSGFTDLLRRARAAVSALRRAGTPR